MLKFVVVVAVVGGLFVASGWLTSILLTLCVLASGWLSQFHLVPFSFISFTCFAIGWPVCSQWVATQFLLVFLFFPFSTARFGQRLA